MNSGVRVRGQPLVALLAILGGWIAGRAVTWEAPAFIAGAAAGETARASMLAPRGFAFDAKVGPQSQPGSGLTAPPAAGLASIPVGPLISYRDFYDAARSAAQAPRPAPPVVFPLWNPAGHAWGPSARGLAPLSAGWQENVPFAEAALDAGFPGSSRLPSLASFAAQPGPPATVGQPVAASGVVPAGEAVPRRWSGDAWMLMRRGGGAALGAGALPATYGASQAGTVLRYRLATRDDRRTTAYLRVTSSLGQMRETSAALGVSARPLPRLPIVAALEARITDQAGRRRVQPVAMAVTEIAPFALPLNMRGEAYAQAGYVGGDFATPFADGQLRLDRSLLGYGAIEARFGVGLWGGAQKGAGRLDVGPSAGISMPLGRGMFGRLALDWRFRVLGNAEPRSGPAVTLSAGF